MVRMNAARYYQFFIVIYFVVVVVDVMQNALIYMQQFIVRTTK